MKVLLILALLLMIDVSAEPVNKSDPEIDRKNLLIFFKTQFPDIDFNDYIYGALMFSEDAKAQYHSIMQFPPFEDDIDRGEKIWKTPFKNGKHFEDCFKSQGFGEAAKYPEYNEREDRIITFEMKINECLTQNGEKPFPYDDVDSMGVLTAYARKLSDGYLTKVVISSSGSFQRYFNGRGLFHKRMGQLNLSCASCHITHAGHYFRDELISPAVGHTSHFPVFRGGEFLFTLHMRYRRCMEAMRATPFAAGSKEFNDIEFFHSFLSNGLPLQSSVYRK